MTRHDVTLAPPLAPVLAPAPHDPLALVRREIAYGYRRLMQPPRPGSVTLLERQVVALFVATILGEDRTALYYGALLGGAGPGARRLAELVAAAGESAPGPDAYGGTAAPIHASDDLRREIGGRLAAALELAHRLLVSPATADAVPLRRFIGTGWQPDSVGVLAAIVGLVRLQAQLSAAGVFDAGSVPPFGPVA